VITTGKDSGATPNNTGWGFKPSTSTGKDTPPLPPQKDPKLKDPKVLTVSQQPEDGGEFRTINEALGNVKGEKKIIRVLDDAVYEEQIKINRPAQYRGLVLEAVAG
jgi:hypothetical protein